MPTYRVFLVDEQGHYTGGEIRESPDDKTILSVARLYVDGCDVEVWEQDRLVARLTTEPPDPIYP
jgi:hypothetical protein